MCGILKRYFRAASSLDRAKLFVDDGGNELESYRMVQEAPAVILSRNFWRYKNFTECEPEIKYFFLPLQFSSENFSDVTVPRRLAAQLLSATTLFFETQGLSFRLSDF